MVNKTFLLKIITPEKVCFLGQVEKAILPGAEGQFTVLPGHTALMSSLRPGFLHFSQDNKDDQYIIYGGFVQILNDEVVVIADQVDHKDNVVRADLDRKIEELRVSIDNANTTHDRQKHEDILQDLSHLAHSYYAA